MFNFEVSKMGEISKKTLAVLFIIAIVLSAIATWKMLSTPTTVVVGENKGEAKSHVSLGINVEPIPSEPVSSEGQVSFTVE